MTTPADTRSHLVKLKVCNLGCIGPDGLEVSLDQIVCLVGANNTGKSTVLRAYEAAVMGAELKADEVFNKDPARHAGFIPQPPTVELWVHIPAGAENIDAKWKEANGGKLLVRSKWTWPVQGGRPVRMTWDPESNEYAEEGKAAGLDNVFKSRLPRPFRIGSLQDPAKEHEKLLELVLEPIKARLANLMEEDGSPLRAKIESLQKEAEKPVAEFRADLDRVQSQVNTSYRQVFSTAEVHLSVSLGELAVNPGAALAKASHIGVVESHGQTRWDQQGTGSQRALFWSMLQVRSELNRIAEERRQHAKLRDIKRKELKKLVDKVPTLKKQVKIDEYKRQHLSA